jgi:hypothetical protein
MSKLDYAYTYITLFGNVLLGNELELELLLTEREVEITNVYRLLP